MQSRNQYPAGMKQYKVILQTSSPSSISSSSFLFFFLQGIVHLAKSLELTRTKLAYKLADTAQLKCPPHHCEVLMGVLETK